MTPTATDPGLASAAKLKALNTELETAMVNFNKWHQDMQQYREFYQNSAVYSNKSGDQKTKSELKTNMLRVFADKNVHYTSPFPTIKVPTTGADPVLRQNASIREKILYAVHRKSNTTLLRAMWAFDATVMSVAVSETRFDLEKRCVEIRRFDPRYCYWQYSNDNERRVEAFWAVYPITKAEARKRYGVEPKGSPVDLSQVSDQAFKRIDGQDWFLMAYRWDEKNRAVWIGDTWVETPHNHQMGMLPIDVCMPFYDGSVDQRGAFYLEQLVPLQAELNETIKARANIVRRMANPVIWGRGIIAKQFDEVKTGLKQGGGGFVGLKQGGELGVLQISDTKMLNEHQADILQHMMRVSGFGAAAFGETVGANTSGDALGMYFNPTQRAIDHQNIHWKTFDESINAKILKLYDTFAKTGEKFEIDGYSPNGTMLPVKDDNGQEKLAYTTPGSFSLEFSKDVIDGNYTSVVTPQPATPKDELAWKRLLYEAASSNTISRTTMYEEWGMMSPEDELALLTSEQENPALNADLMKQAAGMAAQPPVGASQLPPVPAASPVQ